jgi:hypothetical protein
MPGYASEFHPVRVTRILALDERRGVADKPSSNIVRGEGVLLSQLAAAYHCGNLTIGAACRFTFDGRMYLVAENALDFVWLPSDGFCRTRGPSPYRRDVSRLKAAGVANAYELCRAKFLESVFEDSDNESDTEEGHGRPDCPTAALPCGACGPDPCGA